jgi:hypothetical protein
MIRSPLLHFHHIFAVAQIFQAIWDEEKDFFVGYRFVLYFSSLARIPYFQCAYDVVIHVA